MVIVKLDITAEESMDNAIDSPPKVPDAENLSPNFNGWHDWQLMKSHAGTHTLQGVSAVTEEIFCVA